MNVPLKLISLLALISTVVPSVLYFTGALLRSAVKALALIGTIDWFVATPLWMNRDPEGIHVEVVP